MTNSMRIRIAAVATALFIAALSVAGLAVRAAQQAQAPVAAATVATQPHQRSAQVTSDGTEADGNGGWEIDDD